MSGRAQSTPPGREARNEDETAVRDGARDAAPLEPDPLAERRWRHPWSHRHVETAELQNG